MAFEQRKKKDMACRECGNIVNNVGDDAISVLCSECTADFVRGFKIDKDLEEGTEECKKS